MTKRPDLSARNTVHGLSLVYPQTYKTWKDMRARCNNPKNKFYYRYGARGIAVCERWESFSAFFEDMGPRPDGKTIERMDYDAGYCPSNCAWADAVEQANNKSSNHVIEWNGVKKNLGQWCAEFAVEQSKARYRIKQGWPLEDVFSGRDFRK